jgi:2,3-bisphosphoglycerate-dependent phosphoglycerate mutase
MTAYTLTFLRHAESVGNVEKRFQGQAEFPLSDTGREQARKLANRWQTEGVHFDQIIASPLARSRETAEIIAEQLSATLELDAIWMERDNGDMAGMHFDEARRVEAEVPFFHPFLRLGRNGETEWELYLRAGSAIQNILYRPPGAYLIVSHSGMLNKVMFAILGIPVQPNFQGPRFSLENTGFSCLRYTPENHQWRVICMNDHAHLK